MVPAMTGTPPRQAQTPPFAAIVLAGGQSRRMGGGDKALLDLGGRPMVAHVIDRLGVVPTAISANGDPDRFAAFGLPVLPDPIPGWLGPLSGVLAGMGWAAAQGIPAASVGVTGSDRLTLPGGETISIAELKAAHEGWLPAYMASQPAAAA